MHQSRTTAQRSHALSRRTLGLLGVVVLLVLVCLASLAIGSKPIPFGTVIDQVFGHHTHTDDGIVIWSLRMPRTALGLAVGIALGLAGALMQALTRNPLADPGLLGVNAGAAAAVVAAIGLLGFTSPSAYVWCAMLGAGIASVTVYLLGARGPSSATPVRLALAGAAISAALGAFVSAVVLTDQETFDSFRFWSVGAIAGRPVSVLVETGPFMALGALVALGLARPLNVLSLGDDAGRALGAHLGRTRAFSVVSVTLLCGAATAAAGPIGFVGLTVPHIARAIAGTDQRWIFGFSALLAPILLLGSDVLGRVVARPGELEVGIVTAFVGAPVFIALVRRRRLVQI